MQERSLMAEILTKEEGGGSHGADELAWMAFETKMRDLMRKVLQPVIAMCIGDREVMFGI